MACFAGRGAASGGRQVADNKSGRIRNAAERDGRRSRAADLGRQGQQKQRQCTKTQYEKVNSSVLPCVQRRVTCDCWPDAAARRQAPYTISHGPPVSISTLLVVMPHTGDCRAFTFVSKSRRFNHLNCKIQRRFPQRITTCL